MSENSSAETLREKGNQYYKEKNYTDAAACYSQSLQIKETAACYSNRSLCYINLKQYNKAEMDATNAIHCDPLFTKAWLRRGIARISRNNMQAAYYDLLRADELNANNKDIQKQLNRCKEDKSVQQNSLDSYIQDIIQEVEKCCKDGNSNEATSYAQDIYEFRPTDTVVLEKTESILENHQCWKEVSFFNEKLFTLTKSLVYLKKRIHAEMENKQWKTALVCISYYNSHCEENEKLLTLEKEIKEKMNQRNTNIANAMNILEAQLEIPNLPTSLYELMSTLQSLKHTHQVLLRYLKTISLELFESFFMNVNIDCEPYELVIECFYTVLSKNISHCYWVMDVLKCIKKNPSFDFIKKLLPSTSISYLKQMKQMILDTNKIGEDSVLVFDDYF